METWMREQRYLVIKLADLTVEQARGLNALLTGPEAIRVRQGVVVEKDWPEYEPTWAAIQARDMSTKP